MTSETTLDVEPRTVAPSAPAVPRAQIHFVHLLRGLAAVMVMWAHLVGFWLYENQRGWVVQDLWAQYVVVPFHLYQNAGHLGVVLFFLISGFIITHASLRETWAQFLVKRVLRIFPLLIAVIALTAGVLALARAQGLGDLPGVQAGTWVDYVKAALLLDQLTGTSYVLGATWTLAIEVVFYALVCAAIASTRLSALRSSWYMVGAWALVTPVVLMTPRLAYLSTTLVYLAFLLAGRFIYLARQGLASSGQSGAGLATIALLYLLFYTVAFPGQLLTPSVEPLASYVIAVVAFVALLAAPLARVRQPFRFLGDASYSIYLLHLPVGMFVLNLCAKQSMPYSAAIVLAVAATLGLAWLSFRYVERPFQRLARRLSAGAGSRQAARRH